MCTYGDCKESEVARGYCRKHYGRFRRGTLYKTKFPVVLNADNKRVCNLPNCGRRYVASGLCNSHYQQRYAKGLINSEPEIGLDVLQAREADLARVEGELFWEWVKKELKIA